RSPLTALRTLASLSESSLPSASARLLGNSIERISEVANDLLRAPKAKDDQFEMITTIESLISEKNIREHKKCEIQFSTLERRLIITGDKAKFERAISNLIDNATEASNDHSAVEISIVSEPDHASLRIKDYGSGIPEDIKKDAFKGATRSTKSGGNGLGLSSAIKFLCEFGANIQIKDGIPIGTVIDIALPINCTSGKSTPQSLELGRQSFLL
ncbi:MAG: HAMP domain-containing histidine kinase, partial [Bdellovibrionales bacterium]|nr:HAMP domain-containing histidine kinase [Bdellovibrionales bacterium]